jgi:hypothetical protein
MDLDTLKEQAERCRRLAKHADPFTQKRLLDLASEYDARIAKLEPKPSAASRSLRKWRAVEGAAGSGRCVIHDIVLSDKLGSLPGAVLIFGATELVRAAEIARAAPSGNMLRKRPEGARNALPFAIFCCY